MNLNKSFHDFKVLVSPFCKAGLMRRLFIPLLQRQKYAIQGIFSKKEGVLIFIVFVSAFLFCGCITNKILVSSESIPVIDFKEYKKYTFVDYFMPKDPRGKFYMYNDFPNKDYTLEIVEKKLSSIGFTRDDKDPDFAIWVGFSVEFVDFSGKNKLDSMEIIPTEKNYLIFTPGDREYDFFKYHMKMLGLYFFYVKDVPRRASIKKLFALSELFAKSHTFERELTEKEMKLVFKETFKLSKAETILEYDFKTILEDFKTKLPWGRRRVVWNGFVGYFSKEPYLEEEKIPILIDVALDSYPSEHIPIVSDRSLRDIPEWLHE